MAVMTDDVITVVEVLPQILPVEDAEIAGLARKRFEKMGIKILTNTFNKSMSCLLYYIRF